MKRRDNAKASLVDILSAIKFSRRNGERKSFPRLTPFAGFDQRVRAGYPASLEDAHLIRSAN